MSRDHSGSGELMGREFSTAVVMFHQAAADRLGLGAADWKFLDLLDREGPMTAGRMAELTGLTSGAITGVVDRLERAGFARREQDATDRRRVVVQLETAHGREGEIAQIFGSLGRAMGEETYGRYDEKEQAAIQDFVERTTRVLRQETAKLRQESAAKKDRV